MKCSLLFLAPPAQNTNTSTSNTNTSTSNRSDVTEGVDKKGSLKEHPESIASDKADKKKRSKVPLTDACPAMVVPPADPEQEETKTEVLSDSEKNLALRFKIYEASQKDIVHILSTWDRAQDILLSPLNEEEVRQQAEDQRQHLSSRKSRKDREKKRHERLEKERLEKLKALEESKLSQLEGEGAEGSVRGQNAGVPCLDIQVPSSEDVTRKILKSGKLPAAEQVKPCEAPMLSLPWSGPWWVVSHQVATAQSHWSVQANGDVPQQPRGWGGCHHPSAG